MNEIGKEERKSKCISLAETNHRMKRNHFRMSFKSLIRISLKLLLHVKLRGSQFLGASELKEEPLSKRIAQSSFCFIFVIIKWTSPKKNFPLQAFTSFFYLFNSFNFAIIFLVQNVVKLKHFYFFTFTFTVLL